MAWGWLPTSASWVALKHGGKHRLEEEEKTVGQPEGPEYPAAKQQGSVLLCSHHDDHCHYFHNTHIK